MQPQRVVEILAKEEPGVQGPGDVQDTPVGEMKRGMQAGDLQPPTTQESCPRKVRGKGREDEGRAGNAVLEDGGGAGPGSQQVLHKCVDQRPSDPHARGSSRKHRVLL